MRFWCSGVTPVHHHAHFLCFNNPFYTTSNYLSHMETKQKKNKVASHFAQTFLANRNSSEPTRYSLEEICQLRWRFSIYFVIMEEWINFQLPAPIFGDILGGNSSSGGVNDQVRHVYTLKKSPISLSFVAYIPLKSTSEN